MRKIYLLCLFLLIACGSAERATPPSTLSIVNIAFTPSVRLWSEAFHTCAAATRGLAININEKPASALLNQTPDLVFQIGVNRLYSFAVPIGEVSIVLVVNAANPILAISTEALKDIFTGRITNWSEVGGAGQPIQVWSYPEGDDVRITFDTVLFGEDRLTTQALLAPNPQAMIEAVADDPLAIGYVIQNWLAFSNDISQLRPLSFDQRIAEDLRLPVMALSRTEPQGLTKQFLICLQSAGQ